jgi:hypothetical protein
MRPRIHYTESQKALMWERWQKGESLQQIAQLFDRSHSSIQGILAATGGIRPAPPQPLPMGADIGGTGRDLARGGGGSFRPCDRRATRPGAVHDQSGAQAQRWPSMLPSVNRPGFSGDVRV